MFTRKYLIQYILFGLAAAIAFNIPVLFFLNNAEYADAYVLFLGNGLFLLVVAAYILLFNKKRGENESTQNMNVAGHITTGFGVLFACVIALILLIAFVPDIFSSGTPDTVLENSPTSTSGGKTDGLVFMLFMTAIVGNVAAGSIASITLPYTAKRNQTKDKKSEVLEN